MYTHNSNMTCAWIVPILFGNNYVKGGIVTAQSLRDVNTKHKIICMITDLEETDLELLSRHFDVIIKVSCVERKFKKMSRKQQNIYGNWMNKSITMLQCLNFVEYEKVALIGADFVFLENSDELFELNTPAACWKKTSVGRSTLSTCEQKRVNMFDKLKDVKVFACSAPFILTPNIADFERILEFVPEDEVYAEDYKLLGGMDEIALLQLYNDKIWSDIPQKYLHVPWKNKCSKPKIIHYHGSRPWEMDRTQYPDLDIWYKIYDKVSI